MPVTARYGPQRGILTEEDVASADVLGRKFDTGTLQSQESTALQQKRRRLERLQGLIDSLTGMRIVPRETGGASTTGGEAALRAGAGRFLGNMTGIPDFLLNAATVPFENASRMGQAVFSGDVAPMGPSEVLDKLGRRRLPLPSGADMLTGIDAAGEAAAALMNLNASEFSPDMGEASRMRSEVMAQQQPLATGVGSMLGDVATLATLRSPIARVRGLQEASAVERQAALAAEIAKAKEAGVLSGALMAENVPAMIQRMTLDSRAFGSLMNRTGRVAETGLEGAVLGILTEGDPVETAAFSAGTQAAGSAVLGMMTSGSLLKIGAAALAATTLFQVANSITPGGQDRILPAIEAGFNKVALGMVAGVAMGAAGMGRVPSKALPAFMDYMTSLPRAATISVINDMGKDPAAVRVLQRLSVDPEYFGPTAGRRLERAFRNPNISISGVIEDLMENKAFREKYEALETAQ